VLKESKCVVRSTLRDAATEAFNHIPEFGVCGISSSSPVSEVHVDSTARNVKKLIVNKDLFVLLMM